MQLPGSSSVGNSSSLVIVAINSMHSKCITVGALVYARRCRLKRQRPNKERIVFSRASIQSDGFAIPYCTHLEES